MRLSLPTRHRSQRKRYWHGSFAILPHRIWRDGRRCVVWLEPIERRYSFSERRWLYRDAVSGPEQAR